MEFNLLNIKEQDGKIVAFFRYEDGSEHSNHFIKTTTLTKVLAWGKTHGEEIKKAREDTKLMAEKLLLEANLEPTI